MTQPTHITPGDQPMPIALPPARTLTPRRGTATSAPAVVQGPAFPLLCITLPPAFEAFYALHVERYLGYTRAHVGETAAARALRNAFGELATHWADIVGRHNPTSHAWKLFATHTRRGSRLLMPGRPALEYDSRVLHCHLGYSLAETAEVMGEDPSKIRYLLVSARSAR